MSSTSYDPWGARQRGQGALSPRLVVVVVLLIAIGVAVGITFPPVESTNTGVPVSRKVSPLSYPASVEKELAKPANDKWLLPAGAAVAGSATFALDTGDNRILKLDTSGAVQDIFDNALDQRLVLRQPMAIATDGQRLFVANSLAAQVLVLDTSGHVEKVLAMAAGAGDKTPRPIGIAVTPDGSIIVSDANNHRVLILDGDGHVVKAIGTGARAGGSDGFNVPGAVAVDGAGNIYVVDTLNGRVVKLSPEGTYLREFGKLADTAGSLARPKGVAVDAKGRVFVSDGLQAAVSVFGPDGTYLGFIGRKDPEDPKSSSIFEAPAGLSLIGDRLCVMDGIAGLITLRLSEPPAQPAAAE